MSDAVLDHRAPQRGGDMVLGHEVGEAAGAIAAGEGDSHRTIPQAEKRRVPQAPRSNTGHRLALLPLGPDAVHAPASFGPGAGQI